MPKPMTKNKLSTWAKVYDRYLRKGFDAAYAAFMADKRIKNNKEKQR